MVKARKFVLASYFEGEAKLTDFELQEEELPKLEDGDVLVEAMWLSIDPYQRDYILRLPLGTTFIGSQIAR